MSSRYDRKLKVIDEVEARFRASRWEIMLRLPTRELVRLKNEAAEACKQPCGDLSVDAVFLAQSRVASEILTKRFGNAWFKDGRAVIPRIEPEGQVP